jgi:hypothetical protein
MTIAQYEREQDLLQAEVEAREAQEESGWYEEIAEEPLDLYAGDADIMWDA